MRRFNVKFIIIAALTIMISKSLWAGSAAYAFVPLQYSPLSSFVLKSTAGAQVLEFFVRPEIVQYVVNNGLPGYVARKDPYTSLVSLHAPTTYDFVSGKITLTTADPGKYVVVAEPFTNDFPIVTHWSQSLNNGKGGHQLGAADPINIIDYSTEFETATWKQDFWDQDPASPFQWNTAKYAFFGDPNIRVPSYERYVGENYSVNKISDLYAVVMSLKSVERNGYPILHRNHPWAFYDAAPANRKVMQKVPAFQIIHGVLLEPEATKPSLSSYILPPFWAKFSNASYPILFTGFYDINQTTAVMSGSDFVDVIADLQKDRNGPAIGIMWNGGGAFGSQTTQQSAYLGAAYTFYFAQVTLGADPQRVVTTGISRGAHSAIFVAANPYFNNYKVQYALAYCPPVALGDHVTQWFSMNYAQNFMSLAWATGYKYAYKESFIDPLTGLNGRQLFMYNTTGSIDPAYYNSISPSGDPIVNGLKSKGTKVLIATGLNDSAIPTAMQLQLFSKYRSAGIPTEMNIGHRFGHNYFTDKNAQLFWAMKQTMARTNTPYTYNFRHFRRVSELERDKNISQEFLPENWLSVNFPKLTWPGYKVRIEAAGKGGLSYAIAYHKIDDNNWKNSRTVTVTGAQNLVAVKSFIGKDTVQGSYVDHTFPANLSPGYYVFFAAMSNDQGVTWTLVNPANVPQYLANNEKVGVFEVLPMEPIIPSLDMNFNYTPGDRGWGVSTY